MAFEPLVSILLPVRNGSRFIAAAIDSIEAQTYRHWELVLVDDGSTDDTRSVVEHYVGARVSLQTGPHEGVGAAINRAIALASGDLIALHSSDDLSRPHRIASQVESLADPDVDIVTCRPMIIDEAGRCLGEDALPVFRRHGSEGTQDMFGRLFYGKNFLCASGATFRRDVWDRVGPVHGGLLQLQDFDFWLRAAALELRFRIDDDPYLAYRWHQNNVSSYANLRRGARELILVYRDIAASISRDRAAALCRRHADRLGFAITDHSPRDILLAFAYLAHDEADIQQIGHEMLMQAIETDDLSRQFETHTGLGRADVFAILLGGLRP